MFKVKKISVCVSGFLLLLLCVMTYGDILSHKFMIDERIYVKSSYAQERIYLDPSSTVFTKYQHWADYFTKPSGHHYVPFNYVLNVGLFRLFQTPFPLYLVNLLLFYINVGLFFVLVYLLARDLLTASCAAVLFCVHPMTGDILQHITFNIILTQTIFLQAGLIFLYLYAEKKSTVLSYYFSLLMMFLALFCQETTFLFPLYAAALLFFLTDTPVPRIIRLMVPYVLLSLLLAVLWMLMANPVLHLENVKTFHPRFFWILTANFSHVFFWYLSNLMVPRNIVFMCNLPPLNDSIWIWNVLFYGFLAGCAATIYAFKISLESFALVLFLTGFIFAFPASQTRPAMGVVFEPYWLYFSSMGFYLLFVLLLLRLRKYLSKFLFLGLLSAIFLFYFTSTLNLNIMSRTERSYAENWLRKFPGNSIATNIVTSYYFNHQDIPIPSDLVPDLLNQVYDYIKDNVPETSELIKRIAMGKISAAQREELSYQLAAYQCKAGPHARCGELINGIIGPNKVPYVFMKLGYSFYKSGADKAAINLLEHCIDLYPRYKEPYLLIGVILGNDDHYAESIDFWKRGLVIDPSDSRFTSSIIQATILMRQKK